MVQTVYLRNPKWVIYFLVSYMVSFLFTPVESVGESGAPCRLGGGGNTERHKTLKVVDEKDTGTIVILRCHLSLERDSVDQGVRDSISEVISIRNSGSVVSKPSITNLCWY